MCTIEIGPTYFTLTSEETRRLAAVHSVSAVLDLGFWPYKDGYIIRHFAVKMMQPSLNSSDSSRSDSESRSSSKNSTLSGKWTEVHNATFPDNRFVALSQLRPQTTYRLNVTATNGIRQWISGFNLTTISLEEEFKGRVARGDSYSGGGGGQRS